MTIYDSALINAQYAQNKLNSPGTAADSTALKKACADFEAIFIKQMLDSMRKTVDKSDVVERGMAEDIFEDMLYQEYAKAMAQTANLGIADMMYKQLSVFGV